MSALSYAHKNDIYSSRVPTPPRIIVPPPPLNHAAIPDIPVGRASNNQPAPQITQNAVLDWSYERRRDAQAILPNLYLGPMTAAKDEGWLVSEGITMVLGIRQVREGALSSRLMDSALARIRNLGIETATMDLRDNAELIRCFPLCTLKINAHLETKHGQGKVMLFCESGNERSAGVAAAYLMECWGKEVDFIKAMQICQAQRFCVNFDDAMKRLLQGYWDILCAKRVVVGEGYVLQGSEHATGGQKRRLEREDEDEEMGEDGDDAERFGGRSFAPFASV